MFKVYSYRFLQLNASSAFSLKGRCFQHVTASSAGAATPLYPCIWVSPGFLKEALFTRYQQCPPILPSLLPPPHSCNPHPQPDPSEHHQSVLSCQRFPGGQKHQRLRFSGIYSGGRRGRGMRGWGQWGGGETGFTSCLTVTLHNHYKYALTPFGPGSPMSGLLSNAKYCFRHCHCEGCELVLMLLLVGKFPLLFQKANKHQAATLVYSFSSLMLSPC